ncbi:MAG: methyltransferase domain-containing protein [Rhodobacteraceae bacterium]|nr:methyltransferase domain-containing protein [Paracoccaceae bacterium]
MAEQFKPALWTPRSIEDTQKIYADWAETYEADVQGMNYATPARIAEAIRPHVSPHEPILDFGCGTGLSGLALAQQGYQVIDGTDISEPMLQFAYDKQHEGEDVYRNLWLGAPGRVNAAPGDYACIIATGVISLGAAPPDMLMVLLDNLGPEGIFAFSYNDPTLADKSYMEALEDVIADGTARQLYRQHGPHLSEKVTGSDVIVLRRR